MGSLIHLTPVKAALVCGAVLVLPLAACSSKEGDGLPQAKAANIEQLSQKLGCTLTGKRNAKELRQGLCKTSAGRFVLVDFNNDKQRDAWLTEAKPWGGVYLVGPRWVVSASNQQIVDALRKDLGGQVVHGDRHGQGGGHSPGHTGN
jgi:hypothetical protein